MEGQTLKKWLKDNRYDVAWLSNKLGITPQSVYEQLRKERIGDVFKAKLVRANLNIFGNIQTTVTVPNNTENQKLNLMIVPLKAYGGFLNGYANRVFLDSLEYSQFPFIKGQCFAFEVENFSMSPEINPGDYVVCTEIPDPDWLTKNKVYVFQTIDGLIIKVFDHIKNDQCFLKSINTEYNPVDPVPLKSIKKIYYKEYIIKK